MTIPPFGDKISHSRPEFNAEFKSAEKSVKIAENHTIAEQSNLWYYYYMPCGIVP